MTDWNAPRKFRQPDPFPEDYEFPKRVTSVEFLYDEIGALRLVLNGEQLPFDIDALDSWWEPNGLAEANGERGFGYLYLAIPVNPGMSMKLSNKFDHGTRRGAHENWIELEDHLEDE